MLLGFTTEYYIMSAQRPAAEAQDAKSAFTFKSLVFWRNVVGICIVLMASHPRLYSSGTMFLGVWFGAFIITFGAASILSGVFYLFFTKVISGRFCKTLVILAWMFALIQVGSTWALPAIEKKIAAISVDESMKRAASEILFNYAGARKAGISDVDIVLYLQSKYESASGFEKALSNGWTEKEIVDYLIRNGYTKIEGN